LHKICAVLTGEAEAISGRTVTLMVHSGPHEGMAGSAATDSSGIAVVSYESVEPVPPTGQDVIRVTIDVPGETNTIEFLKIWDEATCPLCKTCMATTEDKEQTQGCVTAPAGTSCGDATDEVCTDHGGTCDEMGDCVYNTKPAGTSCGDATDEVCTDDDTCDGMGVCMDNKRGKGTI